MTTNNLNSFGILKKYKNFLEPKDLPLISMGEGNTPLIEAPQLAGITKANVYLKLEGCNPTGSFKDRGMVVAISGAIKENKGHIICASTGNTSASASAYGARYGLQTIVIVPESNIAKGKLSQALAYGARVFAIRGNFDNALDLVKEAGEQLNVEIVNSINPLRIEGQKTAAFEIIENLGNSPDMVFIPVGNAGNITSYWKGFKEYLNFSKSTKTPNMMGFQAEGSSPIVNNKIVESPETIATAIKIGNPASWEGALNAKKESEGIIDSVSDQDIIDAYLFLARKEGVFCEPASAASVAGLIKLSKNGFNFSGKDIVCVITGNGLKDPEIPLKYSGIDIEVINPNIGELNKKMEKNEFT
tara:strand:+ start:46 stop:1122 length:1077 start_codon:yes stop_codon:yes gene_type:complete